MIRLGLNLRGSSRDGFNQIARNEQAWNVGASLSSKGSASVEQHGYRFGDPTWVAMSELKLMNKIGLDEIIWFGVGYRRIWLP